MRNQLCAFLLAAACATSAWSQTYSPDEVLAEARSLSFQVREGRYEAAPSAVRLIELALKSYPDNSKLQTAYAVANFQMAAASSQPGSDPAKALGFVLTGAAAFEKAAALDPDNADALAGRGASRTLVAMVQGKMELFGQGVADMNKAVAMSPNAATPRLQRAFFGLNTPKPARDEAAIETDLKQLIAWGTPRERDHLHILLGDLYAESDKADLARSEYKAANRTGSTSAPLGSERLGALAAGKVDVVKITGLRSQLGSNCTMCHGA